MERTEPTGPQYEKYKATVIRMLKKDNTIQEDSEINFTHIASYHSASVSPTNCANAFREWKKKNDLEKSS